MPKLGSESHQLHMWVLWLIFHYCQCSWLVQYNYKVYCLCQWNYREDQQLAEGFADISKGLSAHWLVDGVDILLPTKLFVKRELDYSTCLSDWHFQNYHPYAWGDNFPNWVCVLKRIKKKTHSWSLQAAWNAISAGTHLEAVLPEWHERIKR